MSLLLVCGMLCVVGLSGCKGKGKAEQAEKGPAGAQKAEGSAGKLEPLKLDPNKKGN